jgi:hypothetical protein
MTRHIDIKFKKTKQEHNMSRPPHTHSTHTHKRTFRFMFTFVTMTRLTKMFL